VGRWRAVVLAVVAVTVVGVAIALAARTGHSGCRGSYTYGSGVSHCGPPTASGLGSANAAWFIGDWVAHTLGLTFDRDGRGTLTWRTYRTCGQDPPPCDTIRGRETIDGGQAKLRIVAYTGTTASGRVISSSDQEQFPVGPFSLRLDGATGMAHLNPSPRGDDALCGPKTAASACPY